MLILHYEQATINSKSEARSTKQIQMSKAQNSKHRSERINAYRVSSRVEHLGQESRAVKNAIAVF